jgi:hypothetical protein
MNDIRRARMLVVTDQLNNQVYVPGEITAKLLRQNIFARIMYGGTRDPRGE